MSAEQTLADFGVVGLGTMGSNVALNVADNGFEVACWNRDPEVQRAFLSANAGARVVGVPSLRELPARLSRPRRILLMVTAGKPVDLVMADLAALLEPGDIVIDGGNSRFEDTRRREAEWRAKGLHFVGMGVSGGAEGARHGPSLMPGGSAEAYAALAPILEKIAARSDSGPCVTHVGPDGAGHFVKTVHNGIEYADMQLLAETYDLLRRGFGLGAPRQAELFARWNEGPLESFLVEVTARVLAVRDTATEDPLVERIVDSAGQKGTGRWTVMAALERGIAVPSMSAAVDARVLSSEKPERVVASRILDGPRRDPLPADDATLQFVHDALLAARVLAFAQGFRLIRLVSDELEWGIRGGEVARIWKAGCILRARLLDRILGAFEEAPDTRNFALVAPFPGDLARLVPALRRALALAQTCGVPTPVFAASLAWYDSIRSARLPQNLTQAQRDAFGAHGFERIDQLGVEVHADWSL